MEASKRLDEALLALAWSLWTNLGVRGVEHHHADAAVDPEALILFTAPLAELDPRLREESLDCALSIAPYLSTTRLKNLLGESDDETRTSYGRYAATFNESGPSAVRFPVVGHAEPWRFRRSGKSETSDFASPSRIYLRLRALFGVGARADLLVVMLCNPRSGWYAAELPERIGLAKRAAAGALRDLELGGLLTSTPVGNRVRFDLASPRAAETVIGALPKRCPPWMVVLPFLLRTRRLVQGATGRRDVALMVEGGKLISAFLTQKARLGAPQIAPTFGDWRSMQAWLTDQAEAVATGRSEWLATERPVSRMRERSSR